MKFIRGFFSRLPAYVLWLIMSIVLWGWIFTRITDAPAEKKITLFVEAPSVSETQLAAELERALPDGIRMIQVHSFDYVMFDTSALLSADLYVVRESSAEQYIDSFLPLEHPTEDCLSMNGVPYGIPVYDAAADAGAASGWISYCPDGLQRENYYLFFGIQSLHTGQTDLAAYAVAESFLSLP
ncbi:MAG: hypothetical protein J6P31_04775 [Oscillospiraceae bacterium]|nr:hypothetical protein [Oscillospiraceae bacterium]